MQGKITAQEVAEFPKIVQGFKEMDTAAVKVLETFNQLIKAGGLIKTPKQGDDKLKENNKNQEKAVGLLKSRNQLGRQLESTINKERLALSVANKELIKSRTETGLLNKNTKDLVILGSRVASEYQKQSRLLNILRERHKSLGLEVLKGNKLTRQQGIEYNRLGARIKNLDLNLKRVDASAGQFNRNVGNYPRTFNAAGRSLRGFLGAFGLTSGIFLLAGALTNVVSTFSKFDQGQADLAAILGRSKKEIGDLTKQAKDLGATTAFTATQISALQLELAKLGFDDNQILAATEGIENLAIATGVEAARAAKLAGAALRGFNLDASESNRVAAALAVSTTKSASSFETLEIALPKVSAIAKSFGFTLEDTTALLGGLQNAGFEASIAGTSLRQIFLQLADSNGKLAKRLGGGAKNFDELIEQFKRVEKEGISLGEAFNLTNARSVAAFKVFLSGADDLKVLRDSIVDVEDELTQLAETKLDSLKGDITLLNSAWEGLTLSVEDGTGAISTFFRSMIQGVTDSLTALTNLNKTAKELRDTLNGGVKDFFFKEQLNEIKIASIESGKSMKEVATESLKEYGEKASTTAATVSALSDKLKFLKTNLEALPETSLFSNNRTNDQVISAKKLEENISKVTKELAEAEKQAAKAEGRFDAINNVIASGLDPIKETVVTTNNLTESRKKANVIIEGTIEYFNDLIKKEKDFQNTEARTAEAIKLSTEKVDKYNEAIEKLNGLKKLTTIDNGFTNQDSTNDDGNITSFGTESSFNISAPSVDEIKKGLDAMVKATEDAEDQKEKLIKDSADRQKQIYKDVFSSFGGYYNLDFALFDDLLDKKSASEINYAGTINSIANSSLDGKLIKYDNELEANRRILDLILNDETASDEKRIIARQQFADKEAEINNKKAKAERDTILFQIAIDTAQAVAKALLNAAALSSNPVTAALAANAYAQAAIAGGLGLAQAAIVSSSPIPAFFKGKEEANNYEGLATWNEHRPEVNVDKDGNVMFGKNKNELRYVSREDIIHKSVPDFKAAAKDPSTTTFQRINNTLSNDHQSRTQIVAMQQEKFDNAGLQKAIALGVNRAMKSWEGRPFKPRLTITDKRRKV